MNRRTRDLLRMLRAEASVYGAAVWIEHTNGSHLRATFSRGGQTHLHHHGAVAALS
jgi:hypothetical protein